MPDSYSTYREYFDQGYVPSRNIYETSEGQPPVTSYEGRFTTHTKNGSIYKTVTSAGLTVDLPSPDSGIGADNITPSGRDPSNIHQVNRVFLLHFYA